MAPPENKASQLIITDRVLQMTCTQCGCEIDVSDIEPFVQIECPDCMRAEIVPSRFGPFLLLNMIGAGGMGAVYRAQDPVLGRFVAIKVMLQAFGEDPKFIERFKREAQSIARLNHPNIVQIYSFGQEKGQPYIVMELVSGARLDKMIDDGHTLNPAFIMQVGLDVAVGLKAAEDVRLLHGDIKPENILLDEKMKAKLADFGLASVARRDPAEGIWGTPYYVAPEKVLRKKVDIRADMYSLGATLYHALTCRPPFEGRTPLEVVKSRLTKDPTPLRVLIPHISSRVESVVTRMLNREPGRRHPTYASLIGDLEHAMSEFGSGRRTMTAVSERAPKKLVITRKRQSGATVPPPVEEPVPERAEPQPTRVVIKKRTITATASRPVSLYKPIPSRTAPVLRPPRKAFSKSGVFVILTLLVGSVVAAVGWYVKTSREKVYEQRREAIALKEQRTNAVNEFAEVQLVVSNVVAIAETVRDYPATASNAVFVVLGTPLEGPKPAQTNIAAAAKPATNAPPAEPAVAAPAETKTNERVAGLMTREEIDRQRAKMAGLPVPVAAGTNAPAAEPKPAEPEKQPEIVPAEPVVEERPPPVEEPEIKVLALKVIAQVGEVLDRAEEAKGLEADAAIEMDKALTAVNSALATTRVRGIRLRVEKVKRMEDETRRAVDNTKGTLGKVEAMRNEVVQEREAVRKAKEEAEAAQKAEEERLIKEAQHKELVEKEMADVEIVKANCAAMLKEYKYREAIEVLKVEMAKFQTAESTNSLGLVIEKYGCMRDLKSFIISRINARPFSWGFGWGAKAVDVVGADEMGVIVRTNKVPWDQVSLRQMLKFISHYLTNAEEIRHIRLKDLGKQGLAAAIFCQEYGQAQEVAEFVRVAIERYPQIEPEVQRLLPNVNTGRNF